MVDAFSLIPSPRSFIFNIPCRTGVMGPFVESMFSKSQFIFIDAQVQIPLHANIFHLTENLHRAYFIGFYICLQFHLFKLLRTKNKISRSYFVSKCLSYLSEAKRNFWMQ